MSIKKTKLPKWLVYSLSAIMLLAGLLLVYANSCFCGFQYNVYKFGLVGDGVIGNVKVKMKGNWYPLWITNIHIKSDTSKYPSIWYARHDSCEDNEFIGFYKLPDNYFKLNDVKKTPFVTRDFPWGRTIIKIFDKRDKDGEKLNVVFITNLFIALEVPNLEYLNEIEDLKIINN